MQVCPMNTCCVIASTKSWHLQMPQALAARTGTHFHLCSSHEQLSLPFLDALSPRYVFFPHWSWVIPDAIWKKYECVVFHMTDLPFGRGGSPLQNLILQGCKETKITALRCVKEVDAGPIYLKRDLSLAGSAKDIFMRSIPIVEEMILEILHGNISPEVQTGEVTHFTRRRPLQSDISTLTSLHSIYDHIRMLDAEGYPLAFLETPVVRLEFSGASINDASIQATVNITLKPTIEDLDSEI